MFAILSAKVGLTIKYHLIIQADGPRRMVAYRKTFGFKGTRQQTSRSMPIWTYGCFVAFAATV
ncbi:hypothetical protein BKG60_19740 [Mycobacterium syngnathidarum]|nr:hypothetical protein BKG60_19740 [Mycobacterium syngnathidarum]